MRINHFQSYIPGSLKLALGAILVSGFINCSKDKSYGAEDAALAAIALNQQESSVMSDAYIYIANSASAILSTIKHSAGGNSQLEDVTLSGIGGSMSATKNNHIYVVQGDNNQVEVLDGTTNPPVSLTTIKTGDGSTHIYPDPDGKHIWVLNDGIKDKTLPTYGVDTDTTGADCNSLNTASVSLIEDGVAGATGSAAATLVKKICVGQGHHKAAFSENPDKVYVSNLIDGTLSVIDNDPASANYQTKIATINLCDQSDETALASGNTCPAIPNKSAPHGIDFSSVTGKIYNSNPGYGSMVEIDPVTDTVTQTIRPGFTNMLMVSTDGNFAVIKATDSKTDPDHVTGKITAVKLSDLTYKTLDLPDASPDGFTISPDGKKIYVVTSKGYVFGANQILNEKIDELYVIDSSAMPALTLSTTVKVGKASTAHRKMSPVVHDNYLMTIFVPNPDDGTVSVFDPETDSVSETFTTGGSPEGIMTFMPGMGGHGH